MSLQQLDADWSGEVFAQYGPIPSTLLGPLSEGRLHWSVQAYDSRGHMISSSSAGFIPVMQMYSEDHSIALPADIVPHALRALVDQRRYSAAKTYLWRTLRPQFEVWHRGSQHQTHKIRGGRRPNPDTWSERAVAVAGRHIGVS